MHISPFPSFNVRARSDPAFSLIQLRVAVRFSAVVDRVPLGSALFRSQRRSGELVGVGSLAGAACTRGTAAAAAAEVGAAGQEGERGSDFGGHVAEEMGHGDEASADYARCNFGGAEKRLSDIEIVGKKGRRDRGTHVQRATGKM